MRVHTIPFPAATPPAWTARVQRWEQLDAASFAVADAFETWGEPMPDAFLLANRSASNAADETFARLGAQSPSRFVTTLPSVTLSPLLQLTGWVGLMICVLDGPDTLTTALAEARLLIEAGAARRVGIVQYEVGPHAVTVRYQVVA